MVESEFAKIINTETLLSISKAYLYLFNELISKGYKRASREEIIHMNSEKVKKTILTYLEDMEQTILKR